ncbi:peptidyl-tRNA hydrolase ICT1, mitochondrial-like [Salvia hispanica]|uniref:peptidyl-tRNA hydrolase ICT1, mitochondrial-like n=1 Tax=Salvia hispanica TaxID=49212 RepID=UPI00200964F7|nr:peptidyl-tRNA hydrolase ICT1, mitochondrial-like [Salvia hispanica]
MAALLRARDGKAILAPSVRLLRPPLTPLDCGGAQRRASTKSGKSSPRLVEVQRLLYQAEERYKPSGGVEPIPRVTLDHVKISYANRGGGGQGFNKAVNTKVDMRFNVKTAEWLDEKVRERIMQMEKHRINKDGEIVISSKKSKAQKSNAEDAIAKLQVFSYQKKKLQAIIDAASYAPVPPSKETLKKIAELSTLAEQKRVEKEKAQLQKKLL